jgi:hypothetical protein
VQHTPAAENSVTCCIRSRGHAAADAVNNTGVTNSISNESSDDVQFGTVPCRTHAVTDEVEDIVTRSEPLEEHFGAVAANDVVTDAVSEKTFDEVKFDIRTVCQRAFANLNCSYSIRQHVVH